MRTNPNPTALKAPLETPFGANLAKNIAAKIKELKKDGITGMGLANLKMVVDPPSMYAEGAPPCPGSYARMFREIALSNATTTRFLITTNY